MNKFMQYAGRFFNPSKTIPTGQLQFGPAGTLKGTQGRRHERRSLGISARAQRRRRREAVFPPVLGTRRGLRRYLGLLRRSETQIVVPGDRYGVIARPQLQACLGTRRGATAQVPNRAQRRWLGRWWAAEEKEA